MSESDTITRNAKSNLAFTLMDLPAEKRMHMAQFYAFCRIVDDIVDEPGMSPEERHNALNRWEDIISRRIPAEPGIEDEVQKLVVSLDLDIRPMMELISGCRSDISPSQPATRADLLAYAYRVAACVGITSATVMGASPAARDYAVALGYALQMVNILRDVAEDCRKYNRVYLPADDMALFGVTHEDIREQRYTYRMRQLLAYEAALAEKFFGEAEEYYQKLSVDDRNALIPAQAMSLIYHTILEKMQTDEYRVFERRYSVNNFRKLWFLLRARLGTVNMPNFPSIADWGFLRNQSQDSSKNPDDKENTRK
ncbi:MAG: phytoene/squalene synthase family protein [Akkermansia sp.]|nr:phytoene/squalene synthase family protein [Akkermansia sp.]